MTRQQARTIARHIVASAKADERKLIQTLRAQTPENDLAGLLEDYDRDSLIDLLKDDPDMIDILKSDELWTDML